MKFVELYLQEIEKRLPLKNRPDILKEIKSTLMDMIEDRNTNQGQAPDEDTIKAVLSEFGSPRKVARQYSEHQYLIGPSLYPIFFQTLKVVLIVVAGINIFGIIVAIVSQSGFPAGWIETIAETFAGFFSSLFTAFGIVTLSFAGIERTTPDKWKVKIEQDWKPDDLLNTENRKSIKITELAVEITFTLAFIVLLNFFVDKIGIFYLVDSGWVSSPILNQNFYRYIPWITAANGISIVLNLYLIRKGFWDKLSVGIKLFINAVTIAINFAILTGNRIITVDPGALQALNFDPSITAQNLTNILNIVIRILLGLSIFGLVVDSIKRVYEHFIKGSRAHIEIETE
jgi:hypothetical protein